MKGYICFLPGWSWAEIKCTVHIALPKQPINKCQICSSNSRIFSFTNRVPSLRTLLIKKLEIEKTKSTFIISILKVIYYVDLVFSNSKFFINKSSQGRNSVCKKSSFFCKFSFSFDWISKIDKRH